MKLIKKIKIRGVFSYTFIVFSILFMFVLLILIISEFDKKQLFNSQGDIYKISKDINVLKNYQDNIFVYKKNQYIVDSDELLKFNSKIYTLLTLVDSISNIGIIKQKGFSVLLKDFRFEIEKYHGFCGKVVEINEQLYSPSIGIRHQLNSIDKKIRKEEKYIELDLVKYLDDIELYREKLFLGELTKREFEKKSTELFQKISETSTNEYDRYYILLFEDNISDFYNNTQIEFFKYNEIGNNYNEGLLYFIEKQNKLLQSMMYHLEGKIIIQRENRHNRSIFFICLIIIIVILLNLLFFNYSYKLFYKQWISLKSVFNVLTVGKTSKFSLSTIVEEYNIIENSLNKFFDDLKVKSDFIIELSKRNYSIEFSVEESDELGKSISVLQKDLLKAEKEAIQYGRTEKNQKWAANGIAKIGTTMRQNTENVESLAKNVLNVIIEYVDAVQGAIYLYNEDKNHLKLSSSISYGKHRTKDSIIEPYEGILGTILVEKREYYFDKIPENYIFLETGLGYSKPKSLFAFPLLFENKVYGIIELALMREFEEYQREFLLNLSVEIAITISYTEINVQTKELLIQSKKHAQDLQSNEKLFKKNQDNLKSLLRMTEQRLGDKEESLKIKEEIVQEKVNDLLIVQKDIEKKDEYIENITNEYENIKSELENKNEELRNRISDLEKRLRDKK